MRHKAYTPTKLEWTVGGMVNSLLAFTLLSMYLLAFTNNPPGVLELKLQDNDSTLNLIDYYVPYEDVLEFGLLCDPKGSKRSKVTKSIRRETRARIRHAFRYLGAARIVQAYADLIGERESHYHPGIRHTEGEGENGLGPMGLSLDSHHDKWPGRDEDPSFCVPEVSAVIAHAIMWRAVTKFHAETIDDVQAIFGGRWSCHEGPHGRACFPRIVPRFSDDLCRRLARRGYSCHQLITRRDLGRRHRVYQRRKLAAEIRASYDSQTFRLRRG